MSVSASVTQPPVTHSDPYSLAVLEQLRFEGKTREAFERYQILRLSFKPGICACCHKYRELDILVHCKFCATFCEVYIHYTPHQARLSSSGTPALSAGLDVFVAEKP